MSHADGNGDWVLTIFTALSLVSNIYIRFVNFLSICFFCCSHNGYIKHGFDVTPLPRFECRSLSELHFLLIRDLASKLWNFVLLLFSIINTRTNMCSLSHSLCLLSSILPSMVSQRIRTPRSTVAQHFHFFC